MTSKEALNQLYILADTPELAMVVQSYYNIVEKDLEFLETIKKYCNIELFYEFAFNRYLLSFTEKDKTKDTFDTPISREDAEKIMKYFDYLNEDKEVRT